MPQTAADLVTANNTRVEAPSFPQPSTLRACSGTEGTLVNKVFGPSLDCDEYFSSRRRIKTKAWNQNYGITSSLGISVRSQKEYMGVWWATKSDEMVLGYQSITFKYPGVKIAWPRQVSPFYYEYNGKIYNEYGSIVKEQDSPKSLFQNFPSPSLTENTKLYVYYNQRTGDALNPEYKVVDIIKWTESDQEKLNKYVEKLTTKAITKLHAFGEKVLEEKPTVTIFSSSASSSDVYFTSANWVKKDTNENKVQKTFDLQIARIGFKESIGGTSGTFDPSLIFSPVKSYSHVKMAFFGIGRSGNDWIGNQLYFED